MKTHLQTIALSLLLIPLCMSCQSSGTRTQGPATTLEKLGMAVARAMLAGNPGMLDSCLPPYEAYAPLLRAFADPGAKDDEQDLHGTLG
jgi:hypothetical protein